ncbi:unnamed protein product [Echinostoma caproni]|uniref:Uncharacterized protein n=1 Tax=Echinostoma caproni TaxID=27848 RepID=A0A183BA28_9TREM|nr:unnamed protein product [Echinostoma caproni]
MDLIPALEDIDCWRLASAVRHLTSLLIEPGVSVESSVVDENHNSCALRSPLPGYENRLHHRLWEQMNHAEGS